MAGFRQGPCGPRPMAANFKDNKYKIKVITVFWDIGNNIHYVS